MSIKVNKNGKEYPVGVIPSNYIRKVDELEDATFRGSVSVAADGVKTRGTLLNELWEKINPSKLTNLSTLHLGATICQYSLPNNNEYNFGSVVRDSDSITYITTVTVSESNSACERISITSSAVVSYRDLTTNKPNSGTIFKIQY